MAITVRRVHESHNPDIRIRVAIFSIVLTVLAGLTLMGIPAETAIALVGAGALLSRQIISWLVEPATRAGR